jgi:hypothetical protein
MILLDNFTDKLNIAYADILEAMLCQNTREEKDLDAEGRLSERRLYDGEKLIFRELYDYKNNCVYKKLYPYGGQEMVRLIYPIYTEQAQRTLYLPIKERILALGFQPEAITKISVRLKNYNEKGQKLQETYNWCKGFFARRGSMGIDNIRYDDRQNIYSSEGFNAYWNEKRNIKHTIDLNGHTLIELNSWDEDAFSTVEVYHYDKNKNLVQKIISNRDGISNVINYSKGKNRVKVVRTNTKAEHIEEGYTQTIKKGTYTYKVEKYYYGDGIDLRESLIVLDNKKRIVREKKTNYITKRKKNKEGKQTFQNIKTDEHLSRYYYNEQGVLTKEIHLSTDRSIELEVLLYNAQGQKTTRIYRSKDLEQEVKRLEKTVYTYDDKGRLLLESSPTHLTHHFYTLAEDYDEHLEITVKTNL